MKSPENKKKWIIDPEAAEIVKEIFKMTLDGKGSETIARILQERKILVPMAYWQSKGLNRGGKKTQANPYKWCKSTVSKILAQQEYCGDVINFKTFSKSFKNKTRLENDPENWAVFKDVHEPIIDRETFEQVQKLIGKTRRRKPKDENYERNMFCDLLYCADCGRKLWFNIKHDKTDIPFFSCGNYHGNRGTCKSTHYLRADAIEQVVRYISACKAQMDEANALEKIRFKREKAEVALAKDMAKIQALVRENAYISQDQQVYRQRFEEMSEQIEKQKNTIAELQEQELRLVGVREKLYRFIEALESFDAEPTFDSVTWNALVERVLVNPKSLIFEFKNGEKIKITI